MRTKLLVIIGALLMAPVAWAGNCPNLMSQIDEMLAAKPDLDEETIMDEDLNKSVKQMRQEGEQLHKSGKHGESVDMLERALKALQDEAG